MKLLAEKRIYYSLPALTGLSGGLFAVAVAGSNPLTLIGAGLLTLTGAFVGRHLLSYHQKNLKTLSPQYQSDQHDQLTTIHAYINELEKLILEVSPILLRQVRTSRIHTEREITTLTEQFAVMAFHLEQIISRTDNSKSTDLTGNLNELMDETKTLLHFMLDSFHQVKATEEIFNDKAKHLLTHVTELDLMAQHVKTSERQISLLATEATLSSHNNDQFKAVAAEISKLASVLSVSVEKISHTTCNINATLKSALEISTSSSTINHNSVCTATDAVNKALTHLKTQLPLYKNDADMLRSSSEHIHSEICAVLVAFQFQDRVNQMLEHVENNLACLDETVQSTHKQGIHRHVDMINIEQILQQMKLDYSMPEQHINHQADAAVDSKPTNDDELTFF